VWRSFTKRSGAQRCPIAAPATGSIVLNSNESGGWWFCGIMGATRRVVPVAERHTLSFSKWSTEIGVEVPTERRLVRSPSLNGLSSTAFHRGSRCFAPTVIQRRGIMATALTKGGDPNAELLRQAAVRWRHGLRVLPARVSHGPVQLPIRRKGECNRCEGRCVKHLPRLRPSRTRNPQLP